jgi:hypothetical protein
VEEVEAVQGAGAREREGQYVRHLFFGGLGVVTRTCACTLYLGVCGTGGFVFAPDRFVSNFVTIHSDITMVQLLLLPHQNSVMVPW